MPTEAKAAQRMFDYYREKQGPRLDAAVVQYENHHMTQIEFYDPIGNSLESRGAIEIVMEESILKVAIERLKEVHPYEEPAYEVYKLEDF